MGGVLLVRELHMPFQNALAEILCNKNLSQQSAPPKGGGLAPKRGEKRSQWGRKRNISSMAALCGAGHMLCLFRSGVGHISEPMDFFLQKENVLMVIVGLGALCFGLLVGWIVSRILRQQAGLPWLQNLIALAGIIIGAAVLALFRDAGLFGWYAVGLLLGFLVFLALGVVLYGKQELQSWRGETLAPPTAAEI
jgi:hypothetical protein